MKLGIEVILCKCPWVCTKEPNQLDYSNYQTLILNTPQLLEIIKNEGTGIEINVIWANENEWTIISDKRKKLNQDH